MRLLHIFIHHYFQILTIMFLQIILMILSETEENMKIKLSFLIVLITLFTIKVSASSEASDNHIISEAMHKPTTAYNWYCKKTSDHTQPQLDHLLFLPEDNSVYFVDKKHSNYSDKEKVIYLTFDAGYENGNIEKILDTLNKHNVKGAFFVLENLIKRNPDLIKRMNSEGHLVCNHTASHTDMSRITTKEQFKAELDKLETVCKENTGIEIAKYYRPPEGRYSEQNLKFAKELGYKTIFWSYAYADWDNESQPNPQDTVKKIIEGTHNGEVILLHPTSSTNAKILDELICIWTEQGFKFGTLDELTQ